MAGHSRRNSRGSFSLFTLDTIRSLSRAGSRRVRLRDDHDPPLRSQSSLSCDPRQQPSPEPLNPAQISSIPIHIMLSSTDDALCRSNTSPLSHNRQDVAGNPAAIGSNGHERKISKSRPLSWLSFPRSSGLRQNGRSKSIQLPQNNSSSTVARSIISAPILQSTTNSKVARAEGVRCGELSTKDFAQSSWDSQVGWIPRRPQSPEAGVSISSPDALAAKIDDAMKQNIEIPGIEQGKRYSKSSAKEKLVRFRDNLTNMVKAPHRQDSNVDANLKREQFSRLKDGRRTSPTVDQRVVRRKTETLNLCRDKIRSLTGHGHVKRKSVQEDIQSEGLTKEKEHQHLLGDEIEIDGVRAELSDRNSDFGFGSLTRSFASAVDKLDFQSTLNSRKRSFLRSKTSLVEMKAPIAGSGQAGGLSFEPQQATLPNHHHIQEAGIPHFSDAQSQGGAPTHTPQVEPYTFSVQQACLIPKPNQLPTVDPQSINPLRCHPAVSDFAKPQGGMSKTGPENGNPNPHIEISAEDDDGDMLDDLEDAPIFSPSLGDLSQYSRQTPSSTSRTPQHQSPENLSPGNLYQRSRMIQYDTPTRPPGKGSESRLAKPNLKKSRSNLGLFRKSQSEKKMTTTTEQERARHIQQKVGGPLASRDENQKLFGKEVKKSKSMVLGVLGNRMSQGMETSMTPPIRGSYQPPTPSPLRQANTAKDAAMYVAGGTSVGKPKHQAFGSDRPPAFEVAGGGDGKAVKDFV